MAIVQRTIVDQRRIGALRVAVGGGMGPVGSPHQPIRIGRDQRADDLTGIREIRLIPRDPITPRELDPALSGRNQSE
jgi:hypothetical protein